MSLRLEPMTPAQYAVWYRQAVGEYSQEFVESGLLNPEDAAQRAKVDFERLLADGLTTDRHELFTAYADETPVATLWLFFEQRARGVEAFVYSLTVEESQRRRGYGRAVMKLAIELCRARDIIAVGLHVFGHNKAARGLYDSLGFEVTSTNMKLALSAPAPISV